MPMKFIVVFCLIFVSSWGRAQTVTTLVYQRYFTEFIGKKNKNYDWTKGAKNFFIALMSDGSFFEEVSKGRFYVGYSSASKKYYFIDLKNNTKKEVISKAQGRYKIEDSRKDKCGNLYVLKVLDFNDSARVSICVKKVKLDKAFGPLVEYMIPPNLGLPLERGGIYLPTKFEFRDDGVVWMGSLLKGKISKSFPYDPKLLWKYKTLPGVCSDFYCGKALEIQKSYNMKHYKKLLCRKQECGPLAPGWAGAAPLLKT